MAVVSRALRRARPVILVGPPGVGKSRVAQRIGRSASFDGGIWWLSVRDGDTASTLADSLAQLLGLQILGGDVTEQLSAAVRRLPTLVILDGCERSPVAAAALLSILSGAASVLATARLWEDSTEAERIEIPPLAPEQATALFLDRARAIRHDLPDEAEAVARIVSALDGIPLALELAASRVGALPLTRLADQLTQALKGQDAIAWSWSNLSEAARGLLVDLVPFRDGAPVAEIEDPRALSELAAHHLVDLGAERVSAWAIVQDFAIRQATPEQIRRSRARHRRWCDRQAEAILQRVDGAAPRTGLGPADRHPRPIWPPWPSPPRRSPWPCTASTCVAGGSRPPRGACLACRNRGRRRCWRRWPWPPPCRGAAATGRRWRPEPSPSPPPARIGSGPCAWWRWRGPRTVGRPRRWTPPGGPSSSPGTMWPWAPGCGPPSATQPLSMGDNDAAGHAFAEAVKVARAASDQIALSQALHNASSVLMRRGRIAEAEARSEAALQALRGDPRTEGILWFNLAFMALRDRPRVALERAEAAIEATRSCGARDFEAASLALAAASRGLLGLFDDAIDAILSAIAISEDLGESDDAILQFVAVQAALVGLSGDGAGAERLLAPHRDELVPMLELTPDQVDRLIGAFCEPTPPSRLLQTLLAVPGRRAWLIGVLLEASGPHHREAP